MFGKHYATENTVKTRWKHGEKVQYENVLQ